MNDCRGFKRIRSEEAVVDKAFHPQVHYQMGGVNRGNYVNIQHQLHCTIQHLRYNTSSAANEPVITEPEDIIQLENTSCIVEVVQDDFDFDVGIINDRRNNYVSPEKYYGDNCHPRIETRPSHDCNVQSDENIDELNDKIIELSIEINKIIMELTIT